MVDGGRVIALEPEFTGGTKCRTGVLGDVAHALFNHVQHLQAEGAHGSLNVAAVRHDVGGLAGVNHGHADHTRIHRLFVAGDDGLKGLHHLAGHWHWVNAVVGQCCVAALATNGDVKFVA